jgi:hypothetical protein
MAVFSYGRFHSRHFIEHHHAIGGRAARPHRRLELRPAGQPLQAKWTSLADADLDVAVRECLVGALSFNGQRCTAILLPPM